MRRQFDVHDILPYVRVPPGEQAIRLERLDVEVRVAGLHAETAQTLVFRNPNGRALEGALELPLPAGATVCGYAIDLDGELVDGTIVAKHEARRILDTEIRKGVDPGLVEQVAGTIYRARIYPLPARGTRTIRLSYVSELAIDGTSAAYHLPLGHAADIDHVSLRVSVAKTDVAPTVSGGRLGNLALGALADAYTAEATLPRGVACDDLLIKLPDLPRHLRVVERAGDAAYFAISSAVPAAAQAWQPRRVAVLWDASGSRIDVARDLALVDALLDAWPQLVVDVKIVRDVVDAGHATFRGKPERAQLLAHLRDAPRDGGTNLAAIDLAAPPDAADEAWLVFSDGLTTIRRGVPAAGALPVVAIASAARGDAAYLRHLADASGGVFVDLVQTPVASAVALVATARDALRVVGSDGCADVHVRRVAGRLAVVGRLTAAIGQLRLAGSGAPDDHVSIPRAMASDGRVVARAWAGEHTRALAVADPDQPAILALAREHGVVTANASLLVLDTLDQHLEHDVEPAKTRERLHAAFVAARDKQRAGKRAVVKAHVDHVVTLWQRRVSWWEAKHRQMTREEIESESMPHGGGPVMVGAFTGQARMVMPASTTVTRGAPMAMATPMQAPPPARQTAAPMPRGEVFDERSAGEPPAEAEAGVEAAPGATIRVKPWTPDAPYLHALREARDPYAAYLAARADYADSPAFFFDCGDYLIGKDRALGLRVLSNVLELGLDDPPLMRMYAWRLQQAGELDAAIDVLERVRGMRGDEPQSHRDLALALGERWEHGGAAGDATRAMDLLYDVVEKDWDRFPEIELIALMELNRLIALARPRGVEVPARIDPRFIKLLDLDLRISMSWDLDLTDVDLHVFEPNGEHAYYGHNTTTGGGLVSLDFRQGYGPEEYVRRRAQPGTYAVTAHYYGSHQQAIAGACTVIVRVMLNFGRANEERKTLTLRLDRPGQQVPVGEVAFASAEPPRDDWRPRFKQLNKGMAIDEITNVVGQPTRVEGGEQTVLVYELGGDVVHVVAAPRLIAVRQVMQGATLDLL